MKTKFTAIQEAFTEKSIQLKDPIHSANNHVFSEGITNQYLTVDDISGQRYLIRINGKLWPPFTRDGENHNLALLGLNKFNTTLLINNPQQGFQICLLQDETKKFPQDSSSDRAPLIGAIAKTIQCYQQLPDFKSQYSYNQTFVNACFNLKNKVGHEMLAIGGFVQNIFSLFERDEDNFVASHNDLLPSSIYIDQNEIAIVDWEYSGKNHRSYDLALLSIKAALSPTEETQLVRNYDPDGETDIEYSLPIMKAGINFLLLLWELGSTRANADSNALLLFKTLEVNLQACLVSQSAKQVNNEKRFLFFTSASSHRNEKTDAKKRHSEHSECSLNPAEDTRSKRHCSLRRE